MSKLKFNKELLKKLCNYVSLGLTQEQAANCCDIAEGTFYEYKKRYPELNEALKKARDEGEAANLAIIHEAKRKNWQASAWLLERQHKDKYALRQDVNITGRIKTENKNIGVLDSMDQKALEMLQQKLDAVIRSTKAE